MSRKSNKQASFSEAVKKSVGKRVWGTLSTSDKAVVRDFAKLDRMGGIVGSSVTEESKESTQSGARD